MHLIVSWDITAQGQRWCDINTQLVAALGQRRFEKPLNTFYVVRVFSEADRQQIQQGLLAVAKAVRPTEVVHFVLSPVIQFPMRYDGFLPAPHWPRMNEVTD